MRLGIFVDGDTDGVGREKVLDEFGPLDEAGCTAVEVVLEADVIGFFRTADAIEVEVVDRSPL